jgi:UDP-glucuronate 4-epimerase
MNKRTILVTGGAGFIGSNLCDALLTNGWIVIVLDNFNDYYNPEIKRRNIKNCISNPSFKLYMGDIRDQQLLGRVFQENNINYVVHLAALAGVRPSLLSPIEYVDVDVAGTVSLLEVVKDHHVKKFIFGSSSSVYGITNKIPFVEDEKLEAQVSPYAAAKRAGELFCATYNRLYNIPIGILRFFTVYGPRQRPDMAIHKFVRLIDEGKKVPIYGDGTSKRDYTYVGDIVNGIINSLIVDYDFEIFNLGSSRLVNLNEVIKIIEKKLMKPAEIEYLPEQKGDVPITYADISKARSILNYDPKTGIEEGIRKFVIWYFNRKSEGSKWSGK